MSGALVALETELAKLTDDQAQALADRLRQYEIHEVLRLLPLTRCGRLVPGGVCQAPIVPWIEGECRVGLRCPKCGGTWRTA